MAEQCETPEYTDGPCHCAYHDPANALRDERIETYFEQSARELAERVVDLEDEAERLRRDFVDLEEVGLTWMRRARRFETAWKSARRRAKWARRSARSELRFTRAMWSDALRDLNRYRLAWLSARRRAADEANLGMEALDHVRADRDRWQRGHETAEAQLVRERQENKRLRAFADEVKGVHYSCRDGEPDCAERFLKRIYDSLYELWDADREARPFVGSVHRRFARGEFDDFDEVDDVRKSTSGGPHLECVGTEEDGGTVWRLVGSSVDHVDVIITPVIPPSLRGAT